MKIICSVLAALMIAASIGVRVSCAEAAFVPDAPEATEEAEGAPEPGSDWWNILLLGGDSRNISAFERTDSIIILSVNVRENKAKMTSIMRDTWVSFPGIPGKGKINAANVYGGPELVVATVNECFGTDIRDYVLINMAGLVDVIDQVGGIELPITPGERKLINAYAGEYLSSFGEYDGETSLKAAGESAHLNGLLAMSYCRNRYIGTDYMRTQRQRRVLLAFLAKFRAESPLRQAAVVASAFDSVKTDLNLADLIALSGVGLKLDSESIEQYRIPADGTFDSGMKFGFWSIRPNFDKNRELLHEFFYGGSR